MSDTYYGWGSEYKKISKIQFETDDEATEPEMEVQDLYPYFAAADLCIDREHDWIHLKDNLQTAKQSVGAVHEKGNRLQKAELLCVYTALSGGDKKLIEEGLLTIARCFELNPREAYACVLEASSAIETMSSGVLSGERFLKEHAPRKKFIKIQTGLFHFVMQELPDQEYLWNLYLSPMEDDSELIRTPSKYELLYGYVMQNFNEEQNGLSAICTEENKRYALETDRFFKRLICENLGKERNGYPT